MAVPIKSLSPKTQQRVKQLLSKTNKELRLAHQRAKREAIYSKIESLFKQYGLKGYEREYLFNRPNSKHRFDWAFPRELVAVEYEGGQWSLKSRHRTGSGFLGDIIKYNLAAEGGWVVMRICRDILDKTPHEFMEQLQRVLESHKS